MNTSDRTCLIAFAAGGAFVGINACKVVFDLYGTVFAHLYTFHAPYTSGSAYFPRNGTFVLAAAYNDLFKVSRHHSYDALRTCLYTCAACGTFSLVDISPAVFNLYRTEHAGTLAVAIAQAAKAAGRRSRILHVCGKTCSDTVIKHFFTDIVLRSVAEHHSRRWP